MVGALPFSVYALHFSSSFRRSAIAASYNDFNQETQQAIKNIETQREITACRDKNQLYNELGI